MPRSDIRTWRTTRTSDSVSPSLTGFDVILSLALYMAIYLLVYPTGIRFMLRIVWNGPLDTDPENDTKVESGRPAQPVQALPQTQPSSGGVS